MEYVTKMPSSLHLFGHMPQKRSRDGGCRDEKTWYREALTHTLERPTSGALRHPAVTKPYFGFRFKQPPKEGAGDVVAG